MPLIYCLGAHQGKALKLGCHAAPTIALSQQICVASSDLPIPKNTQLLWWRSWFGWENVSLTWKKCLGWSISLLADVGQYLQENSGE